MAKRIIFIGTADSDAAQFESKARGDFPAIEVVSDCIQRSRGARVSISSSN